MDNEQFNVHLQSMRNDDLSSIRRKLSDTMCKYNEIIHTRDLNVDELNEIKNIVTELFLYETDPRYGAYTRVETPVTEFFENKRHRRNNK